MFIAIVKKVGDLKEKADFQKNLPDSYPSECVEGESFEELAKQYPQAKIMSVEAYRGYQIALADLYEETQVSANKTIWDKLKFW